MGRFHSPSDDTINHRHIRYGESGMKETKRKITRDIIRLQINIKLFTKWQIYSSNQLFMFSFTFFSSADNWRLRKKGCSCEIQPSVDNVSNFDNSSREISSNNFFRSEAEPPGDGACKEADERDDGTIYNLLLIIVIKNKSKS